MELTKDESSMLNELLELEDGLTNYDVEFIEKLSKIREDCCQRFTFRQVEYLKELHRRHFQ